MKESGQSPPHNSCQRVNVGSSSNFSTAKATFIDVTTLREPLLRGFVDFMMSICMTWRIVSAKIEIGALGLTGLMSLVAGKI